MRYDWNDFVGQTIEDKYVLTRFRTEDAGTGVFQTHLADAPGEAIVRLIPADVPGVHAQERSWQTALNLLHPNLLRVFDCGHVELDGNEFVYGVTEQPEDSVATVLPQRALDVAEARQVLESIVPALKYVHNRGAVHGAVTPGAIVAVGDKIKLTSDSVFPVSELGDTTTALSNDIRGLGATAVEILTQRRPEGGDPESDTLVRALPRPFREIAIGTLEPDPARQWSLEEVRRALSGLAVAPRVPKKTVEKAAHIPSQAVETGAPASPLSRRRGVWVAGAGAVALLAGVLMFRPKHNEPAPESVVPPVAASPSPSAARTAEPRPMPSAARTAEPRRVPSAARTAEPNPVPRPAVEHRTDGQWAVVAAAYNSYEGAAQRARQIRARWSRFPAEVFPPEGKGPRYMVVLSTGLSRSAAENLSKRAKAAGLPKDTYVTKLDTSKQ